METVQRYQYLETTHNFSNLKFNYKSCKSGENSSNRIFLLHQGGKSDTFSLAMGVEQFSFECHKTQTKVLTLTNHNTVNYRCVQLTQSAGKGVRVMIGFGFTSDWMKKWRDFFKVNHAGD